MGYRDLVVVGASAGGVQALSRFVAALPADLPACVLVVLHIPPNAPSALAPILARHGPLPTTTARDGDELRPGRVLVAPPGDHLTVDGDRVRLTHGPPEKNHRPSIDALFRSAAQARRDRVVAVVLSGSDDDGTAGALAVHGQGGLVLVQDPADAMFTTMPAAVTARLEVDGTADAAGLGRLVARACREATVAAGPAAPAVEGPLDFGAGSSPSGR